MTVDRLFMLMYYLLGSIAFLIFIIMNIHGL